MPALPVVPPASPTLPGCTRLPCRCYCRGYSPVATLPCDAPPLPRRPPDAAMQPLCMAELSGMAVAQLVGEWLCGLVPKSLLVVAIGLPQRT